MIIDTFAAWIGRTEERVDVLDTSRPNVLRAAIGDAPNLRAGDPLPVLHHWLYFWDARTPDQTGVDGHPRRGDFLPPVALPRRMWAGGRLIFRAPLRLGEAVRRVSTIRSLDRKAGRGGELVFVTLNHEIHGGNGLAIEEEQDLVYRDLPQAGAPAPAPLPPSSPPADRVKADAVLLFRYSALTMNSHRIHYDQAYAAGEEGYPGLVVQGPLQATLLARLAERTLGTPLAAFRFRGVAAASEGALLDLHAEVSEAGVDLWAGQREIRTMTASAAGAT